MFISLLVYTTVPRRAQPVCEPQREGVNNMESLCKRHQRRSGSSRAFSRDRQRDPMPGAHRRDPPVTETRGAGFHAPCSGAAYSSTVAVACRSPYDDEGVRLCARTLERRECQTKERTALASPVRIGKRDASVAPRGRPLSAPAFHFPFVIYTQPHRGFSMTLRPGEQGWASVPLDPWCADTLKLAPGRGRALMSIINGASRSRRT